MDVMARTEEAITVAENSPLAQIIEAESAPVKEALVQAAVFDQIEDDLSVSGNRSFEELARNFGSHLAHKILDETATLVSIVPHLMEEIGEISAKFGPVGTDFTDFGGKTIDPVGNYNDTVMDFHEKVDDIFSTNFAGCYTQEVKASDPMHEFAIGVIPPPAGLFGELAALKRGSTLKEVVQIEKQISGWLGDGTRLIKNKAGDSVFISKDGLRKVRFDFNRPAPHESPHLHLEHLVNGEWQEISRVYPINVPHK